MFDFEDQFRKYREAFDNESRDRLGQLAAPEKLAEAVRYSFFSGGKRVRPALTVAFFDLCEGKNRETAHKAALALEMIHSYSLIHDDLPGMDNDDYRRGRLTLHKRDNPATAILAGDGLLTFSFEILAEITPAKTALQLITAVSQSAGFGGMVGGQFLDMFPENLENLAPEKRIETVQTLKTGALLTISCVAGVISAGGSVSEENSAKIYGEKIGRAFQIQDDLLDVIGNPEDTGKAVGKDSAQGKITYIDLFGVTETQKKLSEEISGAKNALENFPPEKRIFLEKLADYIGERTG